MGAYIYFKTLPQNAKEANAWLKQQPEQQFLHKLGCGLSFNDEEDIAWARKNNELYFIEYFTENLGQGEWKANSYDIDVLEAMGVDDDAIEIQITNLFVKLNTHFQMKYASYSCALDTEYFTPEQLRQITDDGKLLSSTPIEDKQLLMTQMQLKNQ